MKAIMYHYVRPDGHAWPHHPYLALHDFRNQLDHFAANGGFASRDEFLGAMAGGPLPSGKHVLTFDDGLSDHLEFVVPELQRRGLWGIFYVPTGQYRTKKLLAVHRIHALIGVLGADKVLAALGDTVTDEMLDSTHAREFQSLTYLLQEASDSTKLVKRIFNYCLAPDHSDRVLAFSFNVEQRAIGPQDIESGRQALPRFDCNQFPHGQPTYGPPVAR